MILNQPEGSLRNWAWAANKSIPSVLISHNPGTSIREEVCRKLSEDGTFFNLRQPNPHANARATSPPFSYSTTWAHSIPDKRSLVTRALPELVRSWLPNSGVRMSERIMFQRTMRKQNLVRRTASSGEDPNNGYLNTAYCTSGCWFNWLRFNSCRVDNRILQYWYKSSLIPDNLLGPSFLPASRSDSDSPPKSFP